MLSKAQGGGVKVPEPFAINIGNMLTVGPSGPRFYWRLRMRPEDAQTTLSLVGRLLMSQCHPLLPTRVVFATAVGFYFS